MLNHEKVIQRAEKILSDSGQKSELSNQAKAVIQALAEELDGYFLAQQSTQVVDKQVNVVDFTPTGRMRKPTVEEVIAQGANIGLSASECEGFFYHFESNGWKVGAKQTPMKLWTAALSVWKRHYEARNGKGSVAGMILKEHHLDRIEERIKAIRNQFPLPCGDNRIKELAELKVEQARLIKELGFKV